MTLMTGNPAPEGSDEGQPSPAPEAGSWQETLSDDYKTNPSLANFKDVNDLAKSYLHAQSMVGKDKAVLPTDKSTPEEIQEFYSKLGMPTPDEYKLEGLGEDDFSAQFKELMVKNNILPKQGSELLNFISDMNKSMDSDVDSDYEAAMQEGLEDLRAEWGDAFDSNVVNAASVINTYGDDELKTYLNETGLGNDPMLLKVFSQIGASLGEGGFKGKASTTITKEDAKARINAMYADRSNPIFDKSNPRHNDALKEMEHLYNIQNS